MRKVKIGFLLIVFTLLISRSTYAAETSNGYLQCGENIKELVLNLQREYDELEDDVVYKLNAKALIAKLINGKDALKSASTRELGIISETEDTVEIKDTVETEDTIEAKNTLEEEPKPKENPNVKVAYLTFDDGPSTTVTPQILDILNEYDIKATFFVLGKMAEKNPDILKRIQAEGHSIGNHTYSHNYKYIYKNMDNFLGELNKTDEVFKSILGEEFATSLLRFPGGSFEKYKQKYKIAAEKLDYRVYDWNALSGDSEAKNVSVDKQISRLKQTTRGQKKLLVLMHDTYGKETTAKALPSMIDYLIENGYTFDKLEQ